MLVIRSPLANLDTTPATPGLVAVVSVLFGSTAFDAFRESTRWLTFIQGTGYSTYVQNNLGPARLLPRRRRWSSGWPASPPGSGPTYRGATCPTQFAHSVVPIVVGYIVAHYLSYFVEIGTQTLIQASDPLSNGSNLLRHRRPGRCPTGSPTTRRSWPTARCVAVVTGHVARRHRSPRAGDQAPAEEAPADRSAPAAAGDDRLHRRRALPAVLLLSPPSSFEVGATARAPMPRPRPREHGRARCRRGRPRCVPVTRARSAATRSSGRKWTPASRAEPLDHAGDVALGPAQGRPHPVDHDAHRRAGRVARGARPARGPAGTARPGRRTPRPRPRRPRRGRRASAGCGPAAWPGRSPGRPRG